MITVSTITPVYAGEEFLEKLVDQISKIRDEWAERETPMQISEAIFVNDASQDNSLQVLQELEQQFPWVRVVQLSRNFGQHRATIAGILHSSGDWLVTLDEDLQHDPMHIESMLARAVLNSADLVYAKGDGKIHGGTARDFASRAAKSFVGLMTGNPFVKNFSSFRLIRGAIARAAASVCSYGTYFDVALYWFTKNITLIQVQLKDVRYIEQKTSGYNIRKLLSHARRLAMSSETKVIRAATAVGLMALMLSVVIGLIVLVMKLLDPASVNVRGWTSLFLALLFFGGLIVLQLGIALEYISVLVMRAQGKPTFFVVDRSSDQTLREHFQERKS